MISGFLITQIVWSELERERFSLVGFYLRRVKRIFPALIAVLILASIAAFVLLVPKDLVYFGRSLDATVLFISNLHWHKHTNYFDGIAIDRPLLHMWSLSVEEQFYAVWPLALLLFSKIVPAKRLPLLILALALVSLVLAEAKLPDYQKDAFYLPLYRGWELLLGALLAVSPVSLRAGPVPADPGGGGARSNRARRRPLRLFDALPWAKCRATLRGRCAYNRRRKRSQPSSQTAIFRACPPHRADLILALSDPLALVQLCSYLLNQQLPLQLSLLLVLASLLLAYASWRFVETPWRAAEYSRRTVFGSAGLAMGVLYLAAGSFYPKSGSWWRAWFLRIVHFEGHEREKGPASASPNG